MLAANVVDMLLPIGFFGEISVMVTALFLFQLKKRRCRGSSRCRTAFHHNFVGFVGLVDKEPDVVRGIMIDTGASINIHSKAWFQRFVDTVLRQCHES